MAESYRLLVIGGGSGGISAADFAQVVGADVALVEAHRIGGDCTWTGCVPSKALIHAGAVAQTIRNAHRVGITSGEPVIDFGKAMESVRKARERVYQFETPEALKEKGITVIMGRAQFLDANTIQVGERKITADRIVIATGGNPAVPPVEGLADVPYLTFESVFEISERPERLTILGGGPIGSELAQALNRLGCKVTQVEQNDRILRIADPDASHLVGKRFVSEGIDVRTGAKVVKVEKRGAEILTYIEGGDPIVGDALLVAVGRRPNVSSLNLAAAGVEHSTRGIPVNDNLQTNQKHIFAVGDVIGSFQFTHYAAFQGAFAARNALLPGASKGVRKTVPWVIYTDPEIGQVGLSEADCQKEGIAYQVHPWSIERIDRAQTEDDLEGFLKLITSPDGKLIGASVVSSKAGETVNELALAVERELSLGDLATAIHTYPTYGFAVQQAASEDYYTRLMTGVKGRVIGALARRRS